MTDHKSRLRELAIRGYVLSQNGHVHWPERLDKQRTAGAVYLERDGQQPDAIYLDLTDGLVMPLGWTEDVAFDAFIGLLDSPAATVPAKPARVERGVF